VPTNFTVHAIGGHAEPVIGRAFARPGGFAHPTILCHCNGDDDGSPLAAVIPAKAGIQYAASPPFYHRRLGILGPRLRGDDVDAWLRILAEPVSSRHPTNPEIGWRGRLGCLRRRRLTLSVPGFVRNELRKHFLNADRGRCIARIAKLRRFSGFLQSG
jgi:hypothetical protein